ncbi:SUKH-4 family immunity protein [Streptomyces mangrovisoli]|uniref:Nucleic acid/nucleotide deaminase of polymorphic system toxin n=1 Tax=Streptomyces mangrovisoli TaxID=1428628 RepID=A0A1J4NL17_9ACTN|nr:SUKH-4 family immunity protein [Streptomyces mangrovisoli]OIJ62987.1 hypothetical protein WN71_036440 [Streptomyces mangrovisoli]
MVTFAQAQERAEEWINGDVPSYQHREVRVREFDLGFVVWAEDRADGPRSDGGGQRLVIARDSGEATLWPALPVGEVIRRYEEEYGRPDDVDDAVAAPAPVRVDLNQTSFLLSPPEWLQEAADKLGIPDRRGGERTSGGSAGVSAGASAGGSGAAGASGSSAASAGGASGAGVSDGAVVQGGSGAGEPAAGGLAAGGLAETRAGVPFGAEEIADAVPAGVPSPGSPGSGTAWPPAAAGVPEGATPWTGTDTSGDAGDDRSVPLPATVFAPPLSDAGDGPSDALSDAKTALISGGSQLPPTAFAPALDDSRTPGVQGAPGAHGVPNAPGAQGVPGAPGVQGGAPGAPGVPGAPGGPGMPGGPGTPPHGAYQSSTPPPAPSAPQGHTPPPPPPYGYPPAPGPQQAPSYGYPHAPGDPGTPGAPGGPSAERRLSPHAEDIADAATSKAPPPPRARRGGAGAPPPPPPPVPGVPGAPQGSAPPAPPVPGAPAGGYVPTQMVSSLGPDGPLVQGGPGAPQPPHAPGMPGAPGVPNPPGGAGNDHYAATMLANPGPVGPPGAPQPPGAPGVPGAPGAPMAPGAPLPPGMPGAQGPAGGAPGAVHHAETMLAGPPVGAPGAFPQAPNMPGAPGAPVYPGAPQPAPPGPVPMGAVPPGAMPPPGQQMPGAPSAYGYPQPGQPTVGPGYQAVLRYRAQDGSEQQLIRRSAPGTPHPEWQIFHELRGMNVPPDQVLELHTELESCALPGAYCARMIREQWPQARIASIAPYGTDHASRQQGMQQLLAHQGELHQVADGPARQAPVRAPLQPVHPAPPIPPEGIAQELAAAFGPGVFRFEQAAVSRQGVPPVVAHILVAAGLPVDMGPFFWAQAQPGRPVPTLAELAQERGVQPSADAGSYLVMGTDFGKALCVQYGTANIVAVPVEAGPGGAAVPPQFVNTGLPEFARCLALLGRMWRLRYGLNQEQAGRWTVDFQAQLAALDPAALGSPESWWSVLLEQMWDGLL